MRTPAAAVVSAAFFVAAPGTFAGLLPGLITRWEVPDAGPAGCVVQVAGILLIAVGAVPPVHAFAQFARAGGTPMPIAPTRRLVVDGFNRYLRNPMYAGLILVILGQALLFFSSALVVYAAAFWLITASFVRWYEEPTLVRQFGDEYLSYRRNVRAWWPRRHPWTPD